MVIVKGNEKKFLENLNFLMFTSYMYIACLATGKDGSQSWIFFEKLFFTYLSPGGYTEEFCGCLQR